MTAPTTPYVERWDFSALIAPTTPGDFVEHHWERKPLYIRRERPDFYARCRPRPNARDCSTRSTACSRQFRMSI